MHCVQVNAEIKLNKDGVRGLFATKPVKEGEYLVSIPAAAIINAGGLSDSFAVPTLTVLRELKSNCSRLVIVCLRARFFTYWRRLISGLAGVLPRHVSCVCRFQPYLDVFPAPSEVLNSCNMDNRYTPMWKSEYWVGAQSAAVSLLPL